MPTLLTGATGHLGANLLHRLLAEGESVRVLLRRESDNSSLDGLPIERVHGDLRDAASLAQAVRGAGRIYHCAAMVSTVPGTRSGDRAIYETNVLGTRNLLSAARDAAVGRVVVSGSLSAVGRDLDNPSRPSDESMPFYPFEKHLPYAFTKAGMEHECLKAVAAGQEVVIATSCAILGPHDYKPSRMGRVLLDVARGRMRAYIPGGFEFVAARDIVAGHVLAMEKGHSGERYIFASGFRTVDQILDAFARVSGMPRPSLRLPVSLMGAAAHVSSFILTRYFPAAPQRFTPAAVRLLSMQRKADCSKAKTELGYQPTSPEEAIQEAYDDFVRRGLVAPRRPPARELVEAVKGTR